MQAQAPPERWKPTYISPTQYNLWRKNPVGYWMRYLAPEELKIPRQAQTPQMFRFGALAEALRRHPEVTDEAAAIEACGLPVRLVEGERRNFKVTTAADLALMAELMGAGGLPGTAATGGA